MKKSKENLIEKRVRQQDLLSGRLEREKEENR